MMAKKKVGAKASQPRSFGGVIRGQARSVQAIAKSLRDLVFEELPDVEESFYGGQRPMAMYRATAEVCWIQPLKQRCNIYFMRGLELTDEQQILEGSSDRFRFAKVPSLEAIERLPLREWLRETEELNAADAELGETFEEVLEKMRAICLELPETEETMTWGKPHFRVANKIFCGCGEDQGAPRIGLKMEPYHSEIMMKLPGIEKAPYSRKGDGWVSIHPREFDDWDEIERSLVGSYRLIAPKRALEQLDD